MFDKVKVLGHGFLVAFLVAGIGGVLELSDTVDWEGVGLFGPAAALLIGTGAQWALGYLKKEKTGYGIGVQKPSDQIPGGSPLPTGAIDEVIPPG